MGWSLLSLPFHSLEVATAGLRGITPEFFLETYMQFGGILQKFIDLSFATLANKIFLIFHNMDDIYCYIVILLLILDLLLLLLL